MKGIFVTGTDTNVGKTLVSGLITKAINGTYFKPIQSGNEEGCDKKFVKETFALDASQVLPSIYEFKAPFSPNQASELEGITIDKSKLTLPENHKALVVEGAGGIMVPLTQDLLLIEVIKKFNLPAVVVARSALGTINHTLMTLQILKQYQIPLLGLVINGDLRPKNVRDIVQFSGAKVLMELPWFDKIDLKTLAPYINQFAQTLGNLNAA